MGAGPEFGWVYYLGKVKPLWCEAAAELKSLCHSAPNPGAKHSEGFGRVSGQDVVGSSKKDISRTKHLLKEGLPHFKG